MGIISILFFHLFLACCHKQINNSQWRDSDVQFQNLLLYPWLISDYTNTARNTNRPLFRFIAVLVALSGTAVPLLGGKPIWILIGSQALSPFVMPLITLFLMVLLNKRAVMGDYKLVHQALSKVPHRRRYFLSE